MIQGENLSSTSGEPEFVYHTVNDDLPFSLLLLIFCLLTEYFLCSTVFPDHLAIGVCDSPDTRVMEAQFVMDG